MGPPSTVAVPLSGMIRSARVVDLMVNVFVSLRHHKVLRVKFLLAGIHTNSRPTNLATVCITMPGY